MMTAAPHTPRTPPPTRPSPPPTQTGAASRVAEEIRDRIINGTLLPGTKLAEERMRAQLAVSRSTLREGFQLLVRDRLVVHVLSTGFFVRQLDRSDITDLMATREVIECGALASVAHVPESGLHQVRSAIHAGNRAANRDDWQAVAAASIEFHRGLVALAQSPRLDALVESTLTEFRLAYGYMDDPLPFHAAYLHRHPTIAQLLAENATAAAAAYLRSYLADSRRDLLACVPD